MAISDPIADMLTRIRNANTAKHDTVDIPSSKMKKAIADILLTEGYVKAVDIVKDDQDKFDVIRITLKYGKDKNEKVLSGLRRISMTMTLPDCPWDLLWQPAGIRIIRMRRMII